VDTGVPEVVEQPARLLVGVGVRADDHSAAWSYEVVQRNRLGGVHDITDPVQIELASCGRSDRANSATLGSSSSPWGSIVTRRSAAHLGNVASR
jgi:hypothetical protein